MRRSRLRTREQARSPLFFCPIKFFPVASRLWRQGKIRPKVLCGAHVTHPQKQGAGHAQGVLARAWTGPCLCGIPHRVAVLGSSEGPPSGQGSQAFGYGWRSETEPGPRSHFRVALPQNGHRFQRRAVVRAACPAGGGHAVIPNIIFHMAVDIRDIDPAELRLPSSRASGADPYKLQRQIAIFGRSMAGMPNLLAYEGSDGALELIDGVTRATRVAKLLAGSTVRVEVLGKLKKPKSANRRIGDTI